MVALSPLAAVPSVVATRHVSGGPRHTSADVVWPSTDLCLPSLPGGEQYTLAADAPSALYFHGANLCVANIQKVVPTGPRAPLRSEVFTPRAVWDSKFFGSKSRQKNLNSASEGCSPGLGLHPWKLGSPSPVMPVALRRLATHRCPRRWVVLAAQEVGSGMMVPESRALRRSLPLPIDVRTAGRGHCLAASAKAVAICLFGSSIP